MEVDYLIAGGGLCGSLLGRSLLDAGCSVLIVDDRQLNVASRVAGGIVNPVTGMRQVKSWMIDELMPKALHTYRTLEDELRVAIIQECSILDFYASNDQKVIFESRAGEGNEYLKAGADGALWEDYFRFNYGVGEIKPCLLVDLRAVVNGLMEKYRQAGSLIEERFEWGHCEIAADKVIYKGIVAKKVICCEGAAVDDNPYFGMLPWSKDKGEAIIVSIPSLPRNHIYKQQFGIVPWQGDDLWWVGATHDWKYTDMLPTEAFLKRVETHLQYFLKLPFTVIDQLVARRPANLDHKPFVGLHPKFPSVGILNGMGGKGVSMAPWFAEHFAHHLVHGLPLMPEVDVQRYSRILGR